MVIRQPFFINQPMIIAIELTEYLLLHNAILHHKHGEIAKPIDTSSGFLRSFFIIFQMLFFFIETKALAFNHLTLIEHRFDKTSTRSFCCSNKSLIKQMFTSYKAKRKTYEAHRTVDALFSRVPPFQQGPYSIESFTQFHVHRFHLNTRTNHSLH